LRPRKRRDFFNYAVYDLETKGKDSTEFEMMGFFDGETYTCFRDPEKFLAHVCTPKYHKWKIFAHYGGRYDVNFLFDLIRGMHPLWLIGIVFSGSACIAFTVKIGEGRWRFTDSFRLMPAGLARLTQEFDVEHKKLAFDPTSPLYNEHDCRGLYEVLAKFFLLTGQRCITLAATAMSIFRHDYQSRDLPSVRDKVTDWIRLGYFGGRVETYRWDAATLNCYDVNSLYPYAMMGPLPVRYDMGTRRIPDNDDKFIGFYEADVDYPELYIPSLPYLLSESQEQKLYFPVGRFTGYFTSMELRQAICDGAGVRVIQGFQFFAEAILRDYSLGIFKIKQDAEAAGRQAIRFAAKILLNALYGKFGQRPEHETYILDPGTAVLNPGDPNSPEIRPLPKGMAYYMRGSHAAHLLPHIASAVTSRARLLMCNRLRRAGRIWYTDTDSIFTSKNLPNSNEMGDLRHEGRGLFQAHGLKEYQFKGVYALKGISLRSDNPAENDQKALDYLHGIPVTSMRMAGLKESIQRGKQAFRLTPVTKVRRRRGEKRARDGDDTRPWNVKELLK